MNPNLPKLTQVCEYCFQPYPGIDALKHKDGKCNEICPNCGSPVHPCIPCNEAAMLNGNDTDDAYFDLLNLILEEGRVKQNRTGVRTMGVFGTQAKFDVRMNAFPILTTKKVWFKGIVHELLWFISGSTNIKYLVDNDVHIWDEWAYARYQKLFAQRKNPESTQPPLSQAEFIAKIKECTLYNRDLNNWTTSQFAVEWGNLGEGTYGGMWRHFPYANHDRTCEVPIQEGRVDQLKNVIEKLKTNPDDRRMVVSAWHPYWVDHCALPPCHCLFHFNTEELTFQERLEIVRQRNPGISSFDGKYGISSLEVVAKEEGWLDHGGMGIISNPVPKRRLNLLLYQRSCDTFLGVPFNITSYSLLLAMVAHCVGMEPGTFTHTYGDLHIYENHFDQVKLQLTRTPKALPSLWLNPDKKDLFEFKYEDIKLEGYDPHPAIKGEIAV